MLANQEAQFFFDGVERLDQVQRELLRSRILEPNRECEYGRTFDFVSADTPAAFRDRVPLVDYEDLRPLVDRVAAGERGVLTRERVLSFFKTSGSTADPKLVPVTPSLMRDKGRAFGIYWHLVNQAHPAVADGRLIANFGDSGEPERTTGKIEVLSETSFWNKRMQMFQRRSGWPLPPVVRQVRDPDLRYYAVARLALQGPLHGIMCLNPSTLLKLCRIVEAHAAELAAGLRDGTLGYRGPVDAADDDRLRPHLEVASAASKRVEDFMRAGPPALTALWPELSLALCWQSELVSPYLQQVRPYLPGVVFRDYITQSSECIMAIPTADETSGGLLAYTSHFFEFIPIDAVEQSEPETRFAWELELGHRYELVVTTSGGLYRYRMGDCVEVTGFRGAVPQLTFRFRTGKTSSITGEKLTEHQVLEAARRATSDCAVGPLEYLCFPRTGRDPHYGVLLHWPGSGSPDRGVVQWLHSFDGALKHVNGEYASKRESGRLGPPVGLLAAPTAFDEYRNQLARQNVSSDQVKQGVLSRTLDLDSSVGTEREIACVL